MGNGLEDMEKEKIDKGIDNFINSWYAAISPNTIPDYVLVGPTASQRSSLKRQMENFVMDKRITTYQEMLDLEEDEIKKRRDAMLGLHLPYDSDIKMNKVVKKAFEDAGLRAGKGLRYICNDNDNIIRFQLLDGEIDELLISAPGENSEIVISYKDLKKAIKKIKKNGNR